MTEADVPFSPTDAINARILAVSEDKVQGFQRDPFGEIARQSGVELSVVIERIQAMLRAGTIRRVRQTLMSTNLAPGSNYKLWTTLKVPSGFSMRKHCEFLARQVGADHFRLMPAKKLFALGVGHVRRRGLEPGSKADVPAEPQDVNVVQLSELDWRVLIPLKREFAPEEITPNVWEARAREAGLPLETFCEVAGQLNRRKIIGRFSTFLEHVKTLKTGEQVTRYNALFHWAVPPGRELEAGREVGRFHVLTHAYWREGGPEFRNVNIMAVAHGTDRDLLLAHKAAIDAHLQAVGIPAGYTNVFWGGRSEIKPSEVSPLAYRDWCRTIGLDPETMRE